jgi:uncharacterized protein (TIGR02757 family)
MRKNKKTILEKMYKKYNKRQFVHPDPLEFLFSYKNIRDREIVALIASSLAYGRVTQIMKSVSSVLKILTSSPYQFLMKTSFKSLSSTFNGFRHRFADGLQLSSLLFGAKKTINKFGSLNLCFTHTLMPSDSTIINALTFFSNQLNSCKVKPGHLVALPQKGSACKRMNLFLRWMVRKDNVDPGGWEGIPPSKLIIPLDTHMYRTGLLFGFTQRKQMDMQTALEITGGFHKIFPQDPVKYDFTLTRFGIRKDMNSDDMHRYFN